MNNQEEIWKDVKGFENYQVSNFGRLKRKQRCFIRSTGNKMTISEKIKKQYTSKNGYLLVSLSITGQKMSYNKQVHQLVAIAFLNHTPCGHKIVVDHINEDKKDNRATNLQLLTNRENCLKSRSLENETSIYNGVCIHKNHLKYHANIKNGKESIFIGQFNNEYEAKKAYDEALINILNGNKVTIYRSTKKTKNDEMYNVIYRKHFYPKSRKPRESKVGLQ